MKPFQFFERSTVTDRFGANFEATCCTSGRGHLVFGDNEGVIRMVDHSFRIKGFQAYGGAVTHLKQLRQTNTLASLGQDAYITFKLWSLDKLDNSGHPTIIKLYKLFTNDDIPPLMPLRINLNKEFNSIFVKKDEESDQVESTIISSPVICMDVSEDLTCLALGTTNGQVLLHKGSLLYDKSIKFRNLEPTQGDTVSFVGFKANDTGQLSLFVVYPNCTCLFRIAGSKITYEELGAFGAKPDCVCMCDDKVSGDLAVATYQGVFFFADYIGGVGACWAFEGDKYKLYSFRSNILVVTKEQGKGSRFTLTIYDQKNKFVVFCPPSNCIFVNPSFILSEWGSAFVRTYESVPGSEGQHQQQFYQLEEKDTQTKLDMLFNRYMFKAAITLAHTEQFDSAYIAEIFRKFGDHLFQKRDYEQAVQQYIKTIGMLEPSYVIRLFLDKHRIFHLTCYLEALHEKKQASAEHTTLLLNCYSKLKNEPKLQEFIQTNSSHHFDVETAIKVCRQASLFENASELALKHQMHSWYIKVMIEDMKEYKKALEYINGLELVDAEEYLQANGKNLVRYIPQETLETLMKICTNWPHIINPEPNPNPSSPTRSSIPVERMRTKSSPDLYIKIFVDSPYYLLKFLEYVNDKGLIDTDANVKEETTMVWNTLLELYLTKTLKKCVTDEHSNAEDEYCKEQFRKEKALILLKNKNAKYDPNHALILVQTYDFRDGILYLYGELNLYSDILRYYMQIDDPENILKCCKEHGTKLPDMWIQVLQYFAKDQDKYRDKLAEVLKHIEAENIVPPVQVIKILRGSGASFSLIKSYLKSQLTSDYKAIQEDTKQLERYKNDTSSMRKQTYDLQTRAQIIQSQKCSHCKGDLELPCIHFLCHHSYHMSCIEIVVDNESCPICAPEVRKVTEMKSFMDRSVDDHNKFFTQLSARVSTRDGYDLIAEYFGRGIFGGKYPPPPLSKLDESDVE